MQMIKRPWLGSLALTLSFCLLELGRWESYLKIELRRFTVSFHLPRSDAVSFLHVCLCVCGWESSRVCITLPRSAQKCVYVCFFFSLPRSTLTPLSILLVSRQMVKCYAPQLRTRFYSRVESSWVATAAAVAAAQLCGLRCRRQIYVRRVFRMWTANAARKSRNL